MFSIGSVLDYNVELVNIFLLQVPEVRLKNGSALKGLATISKYLARQSQNTAVLGKYRIYWFENIIFSKPYRV